MKTTELTPLQQGFAETNHNLVYTFLRVKHLQADEYYDIVVFGFLRAVQKYLTRPELRRYSFSTIAWRAMETELFNYYKKHRRKKRTVLTVSLDSSALHEAIAAAEKLNDTLATMHVWHELAARVNKRQMAILRMRAAGYSIKEIATSGRMSIRKVSKQIEVARKAACDLELI